MKGVADVNSKLIGLFSLTIMVVKVCLLRRFTKP
jgi:hypothetical protein